MEQYINKRHHLVVKIFFSIFNKLIQVENASIILSISEPVIFAFNHNNYFETFLTGVYLLYKRKGKKLSFISDWMYGHLPITGWLLKMVDPIYVYNKNARWVALNCYKNNRCHSASVWQACLERLRANCSIAIFPEGTRSKDPLELKRGRLGIGEIAIHSKVPVLPIGLDFPCREQRQKLPALSSLMLRVGHPLTFPKEIAAMTEIKKDNGLTPHLRKRIHRFLCASITHTVMLELARLSGKRYPFSPPVIPPQVKPFLPKTLFQEDLTDDHRLQSNQPADS
jgi:1-acyl-sn-glycerol-3-phosphate acyltransferase